MKKEELTLYRNLVGDIKSRVRQAQMNAALSANIVARPAPQFEYGEGK